METAPESLPAPRETLGSGHPSEPVIAHILSRPAVQRVPSPKLSLFVRRGLIPPDLCAALIDRIDAKRRPSTIAEANGDTGFRTSETCDLDPDDPITAATEALILDFCGLDPAHGEPLQGQRYAVGQEFKAHTDYFDPHGMDFARYCSVAGNRTWTVMLYLNEPTAGGATRFRAIDKIIHPETGKLLAWNNLRADGTPNPATIHHGMKVREGTKYVLTKWFRQRPWG